MTKELEVFKQQEVLGKDFKIYGTVDEPLFLAKDVAEWIEYDVSKSARLVEQVDEHEKVRQNVSTLGGVQETWFLTEDGLYEVLFQSRKPIAKQFKTQVKAILKEIRKTGSYSLMPRTYIEALKALVVVEEEKERLALQSAEDKPKVQFANAVSNSYTTVLVGDLAKLLNQNGCNIGQNRLFEQLREDGYLMKVGSSRNMPTQKSMDLHLFEVLERTIENPDGSIRIVRTTKVTGKGQQYFVNRYLDQIF